MAGDIRPPPDDCAKVSRVLDAHSVGDLRQLLHDDPVAFDLLLLHSKTCPLCASLIERAFPEGFASPDTEKQLDEAVAELAAECNSAETPTQCSQERGPGT